MRNLTELNINRGGRPIERAAPSDKVIEAFEQHFGLTLPDDYLALLKHANGGHPELDSMKLIGKPGFADWSVNAFYFLDDDRDSGESLWKETEYWQQILGKDALAFARDGGDNQFFLDLTTDPPAVRICIVRTGYRVFDLAPSFEAFIDALAIDPDMV